MTGTFIRVTTFNLIAPDNTTYNLLPYLLVNENDTYSDEIAYTIPDETWGGMMFIGTGSNAGGKGNRIISIKLSIEDASVSEELMAATIIKNRGLSKLWSIEKIDTDEDGTTKNLTYNQISGIPLHASYIRGHIVRHTRKLTAERKYDHELTFLQSEVD